MTSHKSRVCDHRKSKKQTGLPWKQPVVDIGFNSVHYQVRPPKGTIMAEWFYENRHGNGQAHGYGAWFNTCLYTHIHILTHPHQELMVLVNLVSLIPFWVLRFFFFKAITVSKRTKEWYHLGYRWQEVHLVNFIFCKVALFVDADRTSAMFTKSHSQPGAKHRVQTVQAILLWGALKTHLRIPCSQNLFFQEPQRSELLYKCL